MKFSLKGIISISGKPGLYKVVAQGNNSNVIVESLIDRKRMPAYSSNKISALDEITMYTTGEEDKPLPEIMQAIYEKENGGKCVDVKDEANHRSYFKEILPDFDEERVYNSDIKKLFSWYTLLHSSGEMKRIAEDAAKAEEEGSKTEKTEKKAKKEVAEKKAEKEEKEEKDDKKEKTPKAKTAAAAAKAKKPKADAKPKVKAESKSKTAAVRKSGGQRGS
ncbi:MAG TPA: DUF5606 domain-containing protein [Flavobacteriales bacterium]|nr:DUF5606 domain-containing protein [Flavobacteriales bacterium]